MSLKALPLYWSKWCIVLQTNSYNIAIPFQHKTQIVGTWSCFNLIFSHVTYADILMQVYTDQQWIQQFLTTIRSTSDGEVNNLHKFLTETFLVPVRGISRQLQLMQAEMQTFSRGITDQVHKMLINSRFTHVLISQH